MFNEMHCLLFKGSIVKKISIRYNGENFTEALYSNDFDNAVNNFIAKLGIIFKAFK